MKRLIRIFSVIFLLGGNYCYGQQVARASNVQMVAEAGTIIVIEGGISFTGSSNWLNNGETHLYKTTSVNPEGWLDSTATGVLDPASTGNVFFRGTNGQRFYGQTKFYDLTIRNTIGTTLLSSCEVRNILNLDTGFVFTVSGYGNDSLLVSNPATTSVASTSNYTRSWVNGRLSRTANITSPFYLFPVGKTDSLYAPVKMLKQNTNTTTWTAEYFTGFPFDYLNVMSPPIDHVSRVEYWEITGNAAIAADNNAKPGLSWRGYSRVSSDPAIRDSLLVAQYIDRPPFIWDIPGGWVTGNAVGPDSLSGYVTSNAFNNFSYDERRFTLGTYSKFNGLPVKLIYFTAITDGNKVRLNWETANEQDILFYEIEKSLTTTNFTYLSSVNSLRQTQSVYTDYDLYPASGWNYYRLKIIDRSGSYFYSPVRPVNFDKGLEQVRIFPNPATDIVNIQLPSSYVTQSMIQVYGIDGKYILEKKPVANMIVLNVRLLATGTYFIQIQKTNGTKEIYRFVKQ